MIPITQRALGAVIDDKKLERLIMDFSVQKCGLLCIVLNKIKKEHFFLLHFYFWEAMRNRTAQNIQL